MSITFFIIVILATAAIIFLLAREGKPARERQARLEQLTQVQTEADVYTNILDRQVWDVFIAGLGHHCSKDDVGFFSGVVYNESDNPVDKKAMAIGNHFTKKIVGYIPNGILADYREWCGKKSRPCVGYIYWDGEQLRGRARVYPEMEDTSLIDQDVNKYASLVAEHFGWELNEDGSMKK